MKAVIHLTCAMLFALSVTAEAQQSERVYRIGFLSGRLGGPDTDAHRAAFRERLRELGYVEGVNVVIEYRTTEGKRQRMPDLAAELVGLKVDVIVTGAAPEVVRAAQQATRTIPIVMRGIHVDPVEAGLVESLAKPGRNITGLTNMHADLHGKRLGLLKEAVPRISRAALLWRQGEEKPRRLKEINAVAKALGIQIQSLVAWNSGDLERALATISRERPDGLLVSMFPVIVDHPARIIEFAIDRRLPTIYSLSRFVDAGGLMSYHADVIDINRVATIYVDRILKGANPAELPVERPLKFELVINLKAAKQIGVTIPQTVLVRADRVIR